MTEETIKNDAKNFYEKPNILHVFKLETNENRHSNLLGYLLNSKENHGLRNAFSKELISIIKEKYKNNEQIKNINENLSFNVYRERYTINENGKKKNRMDFLLIGDNIQENIPVIVIENKIYSGENGKQLESYYNHINAKYSNRKYNKIFLKLSPTGNLPENEGDRDIWQIITYSDILEALNNVEIPQETNKIVQDYKNSLKYDLKVDKGIMSLFMENSDKSEKFKEAQKELAQYIKDTIQKMKGISFCIQEEKGDNIIKFGTEVMDAHLENKYVQNKDSWNPTRSKYSYEIITNGENNKIILQLVVVDGFEQRLVNHMDGYKKEECGNWWIVCKKDFEADNLIEDINKWLSKWEKRDPKIEYINNNISNESNINKETIKNIIEKSISKDGITFCIQEKKRDSKIKFGTRNIDSWLDNNYKCKGKEKFDKNFWYGLTFDKKFWKNSRYAYEFKITENRLIFQLAIKEKRCKEELKDFLCNLEEQEIGEWIAIKKEEFSFIGKNLDNLNEFLEKCNKYLNMWEEDIAKSEKTYKFNWGTFTNFTKEEINPLFESYLRLQSGYMDNLKSYLFNYIYGLFWTKYRNLLKQDTNTEEEKKSKEGIIKFEIKKEKQEPGLEEIKINSDSVIIHNVKKNYKDYTLEKLLEEIEREIKELINLNNTTFDR